jgi:hypothetical protein
MMHVAGYSVPAKPALNKPASARPVPRHPPVDKSVSERARQTHAATKPAKSAMADPLAPLPTAKPKAKGGAPTASATGIRQKATLKDSDSD